MPPSINILVSRPVKLIAVGLPKCASSSLVEVFLNLSGFKRKPSRGIRYVAERARATGELGRAGMEFLQCHAEDILPTVKANPGYRVFSVIRNPYGRARSAYFSKLNRYTKHHRFPIYLGSRLAMLFGGPKAWPSVEYGNRWAHRYISFEMFLGELERLGVGIDAHFQLQTRLLDLDRVAYDRLLRLETLAETLHPLLREFGVPEEMMARLPGVPQVNRTASHAAQGWLTPEVRDRIVRLYGEDFDRLGYDR